MKAKDFIIKYQQPLALLAGFLLVATLAFILGRITAYKYAAPEIKVEQAFNTPGNYSGNVAGIQTENVSATSSAGDNCAGKIKGNISSSDKIYHLPGGSFYARTNPEICFASETEAQAAGFRRSSR